METKKPDSLENALEKTYCHSECNKDLFDFNIDFKEGQCVMATKELRKYLDANLQLLKKMPRSREVSISITKIQEAIMWLEMNLKTLNPNAYRDK